MAQRLQEGKCRLRSQGVDYLAYCLLDTVVDNYFGVLVRLHQLKRRALLLRKAAWPLREVISALERQEGSLVYPTTRVYLRDV